MYVNYCSWCMYFIMNRLAGFKCLLKKALYLYFEHSLIVKKIHIFNICKLKYIKVYMMCT